MLTMSARLANVMSCSAMAVEKLRVFGGKEAAGPHRSTLVDGADDVDCCFCYSKSY